jgi:hypothetical protein
LSINGLPTMTNHFLDQKQHNNNKNKDHSSRMDHE